MLLQDNYVRPHALAGFLQSRIVSQIHGSKDDVTSSRGGGNGRLSGVSSQAESLVGCGVEVREVLSLLQRPDSTLTLLYCLQHLGSFFSRYKPGASSCQNLPNFCW